MSRIYLAVIALTCAAFVYTGGNHVNAQASTPIPTPININAQSPECTQVAWSCTEVKDLDEGKNAVPHRMQLTQSGLPPTDPNGNPTQFYIACGTDTPDGFLLTTGNAANDKKLCLGENTYAKLRSDYNYTLRILKGPNPLTAPDGSIDVIVEPVIEGNPRHNLCMIGWQLPVTTTGSANTGDNTSNPQTQETSGLEYTTFTFPIGKAACTTVYADPFGRVYNAASLKPIPQARVSLFDYSLKSLLKLPGLPNPITTDATGIFNFNIPPGSSYLQTSLANNPTNVHPNYTLAYTAPYTYGEEIIETLAKAEERDIPVDGGATPVLKLLGYTNVRIGNFMHIQGSGSWPLSLVDLMQGSTSIASMQSDKYGNFTFKLDPSKIDPTQQIKVVLTEVDLTINPRSAASQAETDSAIFDPIPSYVEGYAYDTTGRLMPFATVRVRLQVSDGIYHQTKADKNGFYTISPRNLPILPFYLEMVPANAIPGQGGSTQPTQAPSVSVPAQGGQPVRLSTSTRPSTISVPLYAKQNKEHLDSQAIDIMTATKNGTKIDPTAVADSATAVFGQTGAKGGPMGGGNGADTSGPRMPVTPGSEQAQSYPSYVTLFILIALLVFAGSGAVLLVKKRAGHEDIQAGKDVYTKDTGAPKHKNG